EQLKTLAQSGKFDEMTALRANEGSKLRTETRALIEKIFDLNLKAAKETSAKNTANASKAGWIMIGAAVLGSILAFILGLIISRSISVPVNTLAGQARQLAEGDLRVKIDYHSGDEVGELSE